ncbi:O-antigen ligase family protein [Clostridium perfringens]|uniref:O-antigen ligase family protein n=1 Tax=Clostridium perfringens TaxID=1502 RepID=UPI002AC75E19|nr:O-antigen ligase family protein [Clostridium perfringens]MDZ5065937.1 hypothetical protein [Clostridium perfringens]
MKNEKKIKQNYNLEDILVILSILTIGFGNLNGLLIINLSQIIVVALLFLQLFLRRKRFNLCIPKFILLLVFYIVFVTFILNYSINSRDVESIKNLVMLLIYFLAFYNYIYNKKDINILMRLLYTVAFILSIIGIIQEIGYLLNIEFLYNYSYIGLNNSITQTGIFMRVTSLYSEPAHLAIGLMGGISVIFSKKLINFKVGNLISDLVIFICMLFTFSMVVYLTIAIIASYFLFFIFKGFKNKSKIIFIGLIVLFAFIYVSNDALIIIKYKIDSLFTLNQNLDTNNLSSFAVFSNYKIALEKLKDGYLLGTGLDSHYKTYFTYINNIYQGNSIVMYLNYNDAASLYIRIFSEFGLIGIAIYLYYLIKNLFFYNKKYKYYYNLYVISRISLICLICYGVRMGNYSNPILFLFWCILIICNKRIKSLEKL